MMDSNRLKTFTMYSSLNVLPYMHLLLEFNLKMFLYYVQPMVNIHHFIKGITDKKGDYTE